jgi:hypothetical protein
VNSGSSLKKLSKRVLNKSPTCDATSGVKPRMRYSIEPDIILMIMKLERSNNLSIEKVGSPHCRSLHIFLSMV